MTIPILENSLKKNDPIARVQELLTKNPESLPILRQSCQRILDLTANEDSSANDVGKAIMRDQSLTAKIIRLANSPTYCTRFQITTPTQAVTIVGFEVIQSMTVAAELIENIENRGQNAADLKRLLARALISASLAYELGTGINYPEGGTVFTTTMLYSLAELVLAFYLPDIYKKLDQVRRTNPNQISEFETQLLGCSLNSLGASIAKKWCLPPSLIQLLDTPFCFSGQSLETQQQKLAGLVYCSNELSQCLLDPQIPNQETVLENLLTKIPTAFRLSRATIQKLIVKAYEKASQFCDAVNIEQSCFVPDLAQLSSINLPSHKQLFAIMTQAIAPSHSKATPSPPTSVAPSVLENHQGTAAPKNPGTFLQFLEEFSLKALAHTDPNTLLNTAAEALHRIGGFERIVVTLLVPKENILEARKGYGHNVQNCFSLFRCSLKDNHLLVTTLNQYQPVYLDHLRNEVGAGLLSKEFAKQWGDGPCLLGPLWGKGKPVGVMVADKGFSGKPISQTDYSHFVMLLSQVNANLTRMAR